ncbi:peptidoglycan -binding protein [Pelagibius sp.]|uniref:peptidoglycan -binding protein n=1 Tax=Pelagibius sp. TaxID=1931238 RepID=UPI002622D10D|nr:peptidoglycan -binding protein [Pelagibius sp.]
MYALGRGGSRRSINIWPGFVDGLATLLLVVIFVLMVFMVAQFFLSVALTGKDEALLRLESEIAELADLLALERSANEELRVNVAQLSSELQSSLASRESLASQLAALSEQQESLSSQVSSLADERDSLTNQLAALLSERDSLSEQLSSLTIERDELARLLASEQDETGRLTALLGESEQAQAQLRSDLSERETALAAVQALLEENRETLAARAEELERSRQDLAQSQEDLEQSQQALAASEEELAASREAQSLTQEELETIRQALAARNAELDAERARLEAALARMSTDQKKLEEALALIAAGKADLEDAYATIEADKAKIETQLAEIAILKSLRDDLAEQLKAAEAAGREQGEALAEQQQLSEEAQIQISLLNQQLAALRQQLTTLSEALDLAEAENEAQQVQIADLGKRLNVALASKVQELARYRSEFFGRLREAIGNRQDIRIVGDRFVFQSEILFGSGSATIGEEGQVQLGRLAETLREISGTIPAELDWVLRVDGHTDRAPIATFQFPSNWELSSARAISVVKFLIERGIPANRLAATGFGEFQPLDAGDDEIAFRRNRRIEFKLTQR